MFRRRWGITILAALAATAPYAVPQSAGADASLSAQVSPTTLGQPLPSGFVGISVEYQAIRDYTGTDPHAINPVLIQLLRAIAPGQSPVIRIGGNSADRTWWPVKKVKAPVGITYRLSKAWMQTTHALAIAAGARLIPDVNLALLKPALAKVEARELLKGLAHRSIADFEIGNEPDLYGSFFSYRTQHGKQFRARPKNYSLSSFIKDYSRQRAALPSYPLAAPDFAGVQWMPGLDRFLSTEPSVKLVTFHRYPLRACEQDPNGPGYPSITALLSDASSSGFAQAVAPYVPVAHARGLPFRMDEMNSVACRGKRGVSDTFASALWSLDTLFNLASVGVDGVNFHTLPGAAYELVTFSKTGHTWHAYVHPEFYGMMVFAQAFPPGAQLLAVNAPAGAVKVWATRTPDGHIRATLINKDPSNAAQVSVQLPGAQTPASAQVLIAPTISSPSGVVWAGQSFGPDTTTGRLAGTPQSTTVTPSGGSYTVSLPGGSAILLTK